MEAPRRGLTLCLLFGGDEAHAAPVQHPVCALAAATGLPCSLLPVPAASSKATVKAALAQRSDWRIVVFACDGDGESLAAAAPKQLGSHDVAACLRLLGVTRKQLPSAFTVVLVGAGLCVDPRFRLNAFEAGARMVAGPGALGQLEAVFRFIASQGSRGGSLRCPACGLSGLTEDELHHHYPLYHAAEPNMDVECPICGEPPDEACIDVHIHNRHGPPELREEPSPPYSAFAWVVCRRESDGRFLLVNEPAGLCDGTPAYWFPAGRVDAGESLVDAALRETREEAGVDVVVTGVLCFLLGKSRRSSLGVKGSKPPVVRVVFMARPASEAAGRHAKVTPDFESCGALWVSVEDLCQLKASDFRSPDTPNYYAAVAAGQLLPLPIDTEEFRAFDRTVVALTSGGIGLEATTPGLALASAWAGLQARYPPGAFFG